MEGGWGLHSSVEVCQSIPVYLKFIAESRGEIGIAKAVYVTSRGGWVSDRSVVYLALGCPVVLQDTGWTKALLRPRLAPCLLPTWTIAPRPSTASKTISPNQSKAALELADGLASARKILGELVTKLF